MEQVRRWDAGTVGQVERTDQGYLRAPAAITKTGVFVYKLPGGKTRRELRLPDEVFAPEALQSFALAPLTNRHPRQPNGKPIMLTSANTAKYQVGSVVDPRQDGDHVAAVVQVTDANAIDDVDAGRTQLSCGYDCGLEFVAGVTSGIPGIPDGQHYDAIQRGIRGNHVALVDSGRAGSSVQLRLDQADGFQVDGHEMPQVETQDADLDRVDNRPTSETTLMSDTQVRIDGVSYDTTSQVAEAVGKLTSRLDELDAALAAAKTSASEHQARADAAEEKLEAEKKARADAALTPDKVREAVDARLALERAAGPILGSEIKVDEMSDAEIKRAVVLATASDKDVTTERLDAGDDTYLTARYDAAVESWKPPEPNAGLGAVRQAGLPSERADSADEARKRMIEYNRNIGREPLAKGA